MRAERAGRVVPAQKAIAEELEDIVLYVKVRYGLGNRAARRFMGRRLKPRTIAGWRLTRKFPVGFRAGSKAAR